jgi:hypothetical protein
MPMPTAAKIAATAAVLVFSLSFFPLSLSTAFFPAVETSEMFVN